MLEFCYSVKYGWTPFIFWLQGRDFYAEREEWVYQNTHPVRVGKD